MDTNNQKKTESNNSNPSQTPNDTDNKSAGQKINEAAKNKFDSFHRVLDKTRSSIEGIHGAASMGKDSCELVRGIVGDTKYVVDEHSQSAKDEKDQFSNILKSGEGEQKKYNKTLIISLVLIGVILLGFIGYELWKSHNEKTQQ